MSNGTIPAGGYTEQPAPQGEDALLNAIASAPTETLRNELQAELERRRAANPK